MRACKPTFAMLLLLGLIGCSAQVSDPDSSPGTQADTPPLAERLATPQSFDLLPQDDAVTVVARLPRRSEDYRAELAVERGTAQVVRDGEHIRLESAEIALGDIEVPESVLPPTGLRLTDIRIRLAEASQAKAVYVQDGEAYVELEVDLLLDWSLVTSSGGVSPLEQQRLEDVAIGVDVHETKGEELGLSIDGTVPGTLWNWSDFAELADLTISLTGTTGEVSDAALR